MPRVRLKIGDGDGTPVYIDTEYGLSYLSSDNRMAADIKDYESVSYPEEEGEHILPKTVDAAFDYNVRFYVRCDSLNDANSRIAAFNADLYEKDENGVKTFRRVYLYNDYKRTLIVGYPKPISTVTEFLRDQSGKATDFAVVEWTIRVTKPSMCDFNMRTQ